MAVPRRERQVAERQRIDAAIGDVGDALDVAGGLGHLLAADLEELPVDPDTGRRAADDRSRLGDLVLVMREDQVDAAGVKVQRLTEEIHRHRGALEVPSWPAPAPG